METTRPIAPASDGRLRAAEPAARVIAFYLPQFHPIPENDEWWGKGFTEWTNVARARPLFRGHYQPHIPADLGFYDLRLPETRAAQAELARAYGVEAFCYWHYWFAGERLLERPFAEVLASGEPDFPFCLAWANQSWTGIWHGAPDRVLKEQTYPGVADYVAHFEAVAPAFRDPRYVRVDGRPLFVVYMPDLLPDPTELVQLWQELAEAAGLGGVYFVGMTEDRDWRARDVGFDASVVVSVFSKRGRGVRRAKLEKVTRRLGHRRTLGMLVASRLRRPPTIYDYDELQPSLVFPEPGARDDWYPCIVPNWDNTPRSGADGLVLHDSTPARFAFHVADAIARVRERPADRRLVFVKSWNEWAEGNHLEPDLRFGTGYLEALRDELTAAAPAASSAGGASELAARRSPRP